jgi:acetyltransferase-like isoleucine patch superfamily enzyme
VTGDVVDGTLEIAADAVIGDGTRFHVRGGTVRVGAGARLGERCVILCHQRVEIGAGAVLGDDPTSLRSEVLVDFAHEHGDAETPVRHQPLRSAAVVVGDGARVGPRAVIEAGVTVAPGASVPAQTVRR